MYWQKRDDGRYVYHHQQNTADAEEEESIFDTRTGTLYALRNVTDATGSKSAVFVEIHLQARTISGGKPNVVGAK